MTEMKKRGSIGYGDDIDLLKFELTDEEIQNLSIELENIKSFTTKQINQDNFQQLCDAWYKVIDRIPLPPIPIDVEWLLRARPNYNEQIFEEESDISYNTKNVSDIKPNRFNRPQESVFYGTLPSDEQAKFFAGAALECCKDIVNENNEEPLQYFTFGKWHLHSNLIVLNLCFENKALNAHSGLKRVVDNYLLNFEKTCSITSSKFIKNYWFFLSELASTKYKCDQQYFITTAFFCVLREYYKMHFNEDINGIAYPSSMAESEAINIVLMPSAVDKYLYLKEAFMYKFVRDINNKKSYACGLCSLISQVTDHKLNISDIKYGEAFY
jgi:hypothetical protein